jgi:hypothetical protein
MSYVYDSEHGAVDEDAIDAWDVMLYSKDRKGRTNYMKLGRAWAKPDSDVINLKLWALPFPNKDGECWLTLNPFDPDWRSPK